MSSVSQCVLNRSPCLGLFRVKNGHPSEEGRKVRESMNSRSVYNDNIFTVPRPERHIDESVHGHGHSSGSGDDERRYPH